MANIFEKDPGRRNTFMTGSTPAEYFLEYARSIVKLSELVDPTAFNKFVDLLSSVAERKGAIFVAGNGGSAAIGDHLCCDFAKGTYHPKHPPLRPHSLSANVAVYSAFANDFGFENAFSASLDVYGESKDILIAISSSGSSPNIIEAISKAKELGMKVVGMTGFEGGEVRKRVDISLHVPMNNYGLVEDCHQMIMHCAAQFLAIQRKEVVAKI